MEITSKIRDISDGREELDVTLVANADEVSECVNQFFDDIAKRDIPGFRKGKAPRDVLESHVGGHESAMGGVVEILVNEHAFKALDDADIIFIEEPDFNVAETLEEGKPFSFSCSGVVAPRMKLSSYDPVSVEMPPDRATEGEIDIQIRELQDYYHSYKTIDDQNHEAALGDYVNIHFTVTDMQGKVVSGLKDVPRMIGLGSGSMPESFDQALIGAKAGSVIEFDFDARDESGRSKYGSGDLHAKVTIDSLRECVLPPLNELALKVGCEDEEDMRKNMRLNINQQKGEELPKLLTRRTTNKLVERLVGEVPDYYVDFIRQDVTNEFMHKLEDEGSSLQQFVMDTKTNAEDMQNDLLEEARRRAARDCAMEALFAEKGWEITEEDIDFLLEGYDNAEEAKKQYIAAHKVSDLRKMCRQTKVMQWLIDTADVTTVDTTAL